MKLSRRCYSSFFGLFVCTEGHQGCVGVSLLPWSDFVLVVAFVGTENLWWWICHYGSWFHLPYLKGRMGSCLHDESLQDELEPITNAEKAFVMHARKHSARRWTGTNGSGFSSSSCRALSSLHDENVHSIGCRLQFILVQKT